MLSGGIRRNLFIIRYLSSKNLHGANVNFSAEKSPLYQLRQKTGLSYILCREALDKHQNDVDQAEVWLKAKALSHGLQKAVKVRGRSTREGLIGLAIRNDHKLATVIQLNCETDFVAKNQIFKDFARHLTEQVASTDKNCTANNVADQFVKELIPGKEILKSLDEQIAPLITRLGENIKLERVSHYQVTGNDSMIFGQIHAQVGQNATGELDISVGRFGAIVALRCANYPDNERLTSVGNRLCRHVIGYNPTYIELPDAIREQLEETEKQRSESSSCDCAENEYSDTEESYITKSDGREEWPSIMDQPLIMSDNEMVREFCDKNRVKILYFSRFECGEFA